MTGERVRFFALKLATSLRRRHKFTSSFACKSELNTAIECTKSAGRLRIAQLFRHITEMQSASKSSLEAISENRRPTQSKRCSREYPLSLVSEPSIQFIGSVPYFPDLIRRGFKAAALGRLEA